MNAESPVAYPLKAFQREAVDTLVEVFTDTAGKIARASSKRRDIALAQGVALLRAPTGSGKTLTMGRAIESLVGKLPAKTAWFWFAPFSGLVAQTEEALRAQCPGLNLRDLRTDRVADACRDGDVFLSTWAGVAVERKDTRIVRQDDDPMPSVDTLLLALRAGGWTIGVVVDEAHVNFGASAKQAAAFYLNVLQPDFTLLATATPKDEALDAFCAQSHIEKINRIEISRDDAVRAGLNKVGVKAIYFRAHARDENLLDMDEVALTAGWRRHLAIKEQLAALGIPLTPLMLVQVDNTTQAGADPVAKARDCLQSLGVRPDSIAIHTSGQPDPFFHTLAYAEEKEVLIFKVAVATGFDAPRAWTLVSLRPTQGPEFGQQIIGRIMRVHPRLQRSHGSHPLLDCGYVFLSSPDQQSGLRAAAGELKALEHTIETVTDHVVVFEAATGVEAVLTAERGFIDLLDSPAASVGDLLLQPASTFHSDPVHLRAAALNANATLDSWVGENWAFTPPVAAPSREGIPGAGIESKVGYRLRDDIAFPLALCREVMPADMDGLVHCIGDLIDFGDSVVNLMLRTKGKATVTEADLFGLDVDRHEEDFPLSNARISQQAQLAFRFNDSIDDRELKPVLVSRLRNEFRKRGLDQPSESDLRRAVDLVGMIMPHLLHNACRDCMAANVEVRQDEPIPDTYWGPPGLEPAVRSLYRVFPAELNREERAFAEFLEADDTGTVLWWLRNVENARWAVTIVLPNGRRHFPDFVIGVDGRKTDDHIALVETKDNGETGRLFAKANTDKVRTDHSIYGSALMVFRDPDGGWQKIAYNPAIRMHMPSGPLSIRDLVWLRG